MAMPIPRFVTSGLSRLDAEALTIASGTEGEVRDALAALWWLYGAQVRTEVKVPDCGRIDILVTAPDWALVIELKKSITTPTQARQAFQQANTYVAYLSAEEFAAPSELRRMVYGVVTAWDFDPDATTSAQRAFGDVDGMELSSTMYLATEGAPSYGFGARDWRAKPLIAHRLRTLRSLVTGLDRARREIVHAEEDARLKEIAS